MLTVMNVRGKHEWDILKGRSHNNNILTLGNFVSIMRNIQQPQWVAYRLYCMVFTNRYQQAYS